MVGRKTAAGILFCCMLLLCAGGVFSDGLLTMELSLSSLILETREADPIITEAGQISGYDIKNSYWGWMTAGSGAFSFKSKGNRSVKADLAFSFTAPELDLGAAFGADPGELLVPVLSLDRAYVKSRFPHFRLTAGKTRLGWGDGFVFNSGDVIFGSTDTAVDLTASEIRTETDWLLALNIPLGRFSFLEGVVLAPETDTAEGFAVGRIENSSAGGRIYTKLAGIKLEGGYFFDQTGDEASSTGWEKALHRPYIGLQGNLLADWYLASSAAFPVDGDIEKTVKDSLNISAGIFHMISLTSISSLTFRVEGLYRPWHEWEEQPREEDSEAPSYGIMLYPEIGYSPGDTISLSVRSLWSPIDRSAMITAGAAWNVFEGFDLSCYAVVNAGDPDDTFAWERSAGLWTAGTDVVDSMAVIIGLNYIY